MRFAWLISLLGLSFSAWSASVAVTVKPLSEVMIYPDLTAPATTVSLNDSQLSAEIDARIIDIPVLVGDQVKQGDVLLRLDCELHELALDRSRAALKSLQARLEFADYQYERAKSLRPKGGVSEEVLIQRKADLQALRADVDGQKAALRQAEIDVDRCVLHAPFDAVVTARLGQTGEQARQGTPLLQVVEFNNLEVAAKVRGEDAASLENASHINFESLGESYPVKLRIVSPVLDARERSRSARLVFDNEAALPGSAGEIKWRHDMPHVPSSLMVRRNGKLGLFISRNNMARFEPFPDASEGRPAQVSLPMDSLIIIDGRHALQDGDTISK